MEIDKWSKSELVIIRGGLVNVLVLSFFYKNQKMHLTTILNKCESTFAYN